MTKIHVEAYQTKKGVFLIKNNTPNCVESTLSIIFLYIHKEKDDGFVPRNLF